MTTVMMVLAYLLLIPYWSIAGAASATLAGFVFHAVVTYFVSRRVFSVQYQFGRIALMLGGAVGMQK